MSFTDSTNTNIFTSAFMHMYVISLKSRSSALALLTSMGRPEEDEYRNILFACLGFEHCGFLDFFVCRLLLSNSCENNWL